MRPRQLSGQDVVKILTRFGFEVIGVRGSHVKVRRVTSSGERQALTLPLHRSLAPGTVRGIFRQVSRFVPEHELRPLFFVQS